jgi:hypothetical protein
MGKGSSGYLARNEIVVKTVYFLTSSAACGVGDMAVPTVQVGRRGGA